MVFSSIRFLFFFLPLLLIIYFSFPKKFKNLILLLFSLIFYYFGEKNYTLLLVFSCLVNYGLGLVISKNKKKLYLIIGITFNLVLLIYYKYTGFFIENFTNLFHLNPISLNIVLPLGISFFTFQNLSYLIDVYKNEVSCQKNPLTYCTYICLFPQLVAGPIVRYKDVNEQLKNRTENFEKFSSGVSRLIIGLSKKVLIADTLYYTYTAILTSELSTISYWLVALLFTFQIYYDFSGYSDMAIGLGKMFGFEFKENFNYPLIASSITEFWRRWHLSLSTFFKDYVYIPLGGNRTSKLKHIRNIFIVWLLTGLWHGDSWNFILWGLYFFVLLILEKFIFQKFLKGGFFSHIYTFVLLLISFVIFNTTDLEELLLFLKGLIGIQKDWINQETLYYLKNNLIILLIAFIGIHPKLKDTIQKLKKGKRNKGIESLYSLILLGLFLLVIARILASSFTPFIYFRF
ncbi:MAG: MBOAT family protein [Bacilli bacterium]|nr:MBOAT family protein [Bacilli bacterium]